MPGMSLPSTAVLSFGIPAASLPEKRGESAVCLFFINLHTRTGQDAHAPQASRKIQLNQDCKEGAARRSLHRWPLPGGNGGEVGGLPSYQTHREERNQSRPLFSMSAGLAGAVNVRISSAVSTPRER